MKTNISVIQPGNFRKYLYRSTLFFIILTGFAQMPIFKRYYIADIPGLGWLDQFYLTHYFHYIAASALLAVIFNGAVEYMITLRNRCHITVSGWIRSGLLAGLIMTGSLMVLKNYSGYWFSQNVIIVLDIVHIALTVLYIGIALWSLLTGMKWITLTER
jgi:hypothetical protein